MRITASIPRQRQAAAGRRLGSRRAPPSRPPPPAIPAPPAMNSRGPAGVAGPSNQPEWAGGPAAFEKGVGNETSGNGSSRRVRGPPRATIAAALRNWRRGSLTLKVTKRAPGRRRNTAGPGNRRNYLGVHARPPSGNAAAKFRARANSPGRARFLIKNLLRRRGEVGKKGGAPRIKLMSSRHYARR